MVALVFLVSFLLAAQDHGVCWLNQCQPNKCYEWFDVFICHSLSEWDPQRERERGGERPQQTAQSNEIKRGEKITDNSFDFTFFVPSLGASSSGRTMRGRPQLVTWFMNRQFPKIPENPKNQSPRHCQPLSCIATCALPLGLRNDEKCFNKIEANPWLSCSKQSLGGPSHWS